MKRVTLLFAGGLSLCLLVVQLIPYGRDHTNPPVVAEPSWSGQQTRATAVRLCYDCHSNETKWLWYSNVAPVSWLVQRDVDVGRHELNFSEWGLERGEDEVVEAVQEGEMPPWIYLLTRPGARLSASEMDVFLQGLTTTFGGGGRGDD